MGENHPGVMETPMSDRERLEKRVAWTRERVHLTHAAVEQAEHDHKAALAVLDAHKAGENR